MAKIGEDEVICFNHQTGMKTWYWLSKQESLMLTLSAKDDEQTRDRRRGKKALTLSAKDDDGVQEGRKWARRHENERED